MADLIAHLLRRAGFGSTPQEYLDYAAKGFEAAVDYLIDYEGVPDSPADDPPPSAFDTGAVQELQRWWLSRLLKTSRPLQEKMTLFWHGHFATANVKVQSPELMWRQNALMRRHALGNFRDLLREMTVDPAMIIWLDGNRNRRAAPNENYARELFELFALGIGNYTEDDIKQAARALTGWTVQSDGRYHRNGRAVFNRNQWDAGEKTIFGQRGAFDAQGVADLAAAHPATGPFLARKLYQFFVGPEPNPATVERVAEIYYAGGYEVRPMVRALLLSDDFRSPAAYRGAIASPVELVVGTFNRLDLTDLTPEQLNAVINITRRLGQNLFNPPSVKGWDGGAAWIDTATMLDRFNFANNLINNRAMKERGIGGLLQVMRTEGDSPDGVIDLLDERLLHGDMPEAMRAPLLRYLQTWPDGPALFTLDERTLDTKGRGLVRLVLASQTYQRN